MSKKVVSKALNREEKQILASVEAGEWRSAQPTRSERQHLARAAAMTLRKDRRVNLRISSRDLEAIQKRALAEGLPYQTLISSVLHKYADGRLGETGR